MAIHNKDVRCSEICRYIELVPCLRHTLYWGMRLWRNCARSEEYERSRVFKVGIRYERDRSLIKRCKIWLEQPANQPALLILDFVTSVLCGVGEDQDSGGEGWGWGVGWDLERKGSLSRLKGNFQNHVDSKSKVNQRLFKRWRGAYWWCEVVPLDPALQIKKRHNSASIWKVLYPSDKSWWKRSKRSKRERERERLRKVWGRGWIPSFVSSCTLYWSYACRLGNS